MLKNKIILITGGATGIGRETALMLARNRAQVIINYNRNEAGAVSLTDQIAKEGLEAIKVRADISKEEEVESMFMAIKKKYSKVDVLINNAGVMKIGLLMMTSVADFDDMVSVNCRGMFLCTRHAAKMMMKHKDGKIINVSSILGKKGTKGQVIYSASKSFVDGFTKAAAKELGPLGITVNTVAPGIVETDFIKGLDEKTKNETIKSISLGRIAQPADIAKVILFLASGNADYVTGQVLGVDGGMVV